METTDNKYERAVSRMREIKKFYGKVTKFAIFLILFMVLNYFLGWMSYWVYIGLGFWGLALVFNAFKLFGPNIIFGEGWENRMIEREIRKEEKKTFYS